MGRHRLGRWRAGVCLCLGLALAAVPVVAVAQATDPAPTHRVFLELGGLSQGLEDELASPLRYSGTSPAAGLAYARASRGWEWAARIAAARHDMQSAITADGGGVEETAWLGGTVELRWPVLRRSRVELWAGPGLGFHGQIRRHTYVRGTWLNFTDALAALQASIFASWDLGGTGEISGSLGLPVIGVVRREEYAGLAARPPEVTVALPPALLLATQRLEYSLPMASRWELRAFHELTAIRFDAPVELRTVTQRYGVGFGWRLGGAR